MFCYFSCPIWTNIILNTKNTMNQKYVSECRSSATRIYFEIVPDLLCVYSSPFLNATAFCFLLMVNVMMCLSWGDFFRVRAVLFSLPTIGSLFELFIKSLWKPYHTFLVSNFQCCLRVNTMSPFPVSLRLSGISNHWGRARLVSMIAHSSKIIYFKSNSTVMSCMHGIPSVSRFSLGLMYYCRIEFCENGLFDKVLS